MDTLIINQLALAVYIGTHEFEQENLQTILLDLAIAMDIEPAAASDQLKDAIDYEVIVNDLQGLVEGRRFQLLETLAKWVADYLYQRWQIIDAEITLTKPDALDGEVKVSVVHRLAVDVNMITQEELECQRETTH
ncbi:MAG: dihydroneopterin aldolase [Coxiellaceae bacterium]|nr:dihydroneopterin aldolase [Coxiellaceae bacterium]